MNTIAYEVEQARIILRNVHEPRIASRMSHYGYGPARWEEGQALLDQFLERWQSQKEDYQSKGTIGRNLQADMREMYRLLMDHRALAKWIFRHDADEYQRLGLHQIISNRVLTKIEQARSFYYGALKNPRLLVRHGLSKAELEQGQAMVEAVVEARHLRLQKSGIAQDATQQRDEVRQALRTWVIDVRTIARIALRDEPQLLEVLGIGVRLNVVPKAQEETSLSSSEPVQPAVEPAPHPTDV